MQFETLVRCEVPRCNCPEHGVKTVDVPWAGKGSRFTLLFESFAIDVLKACSSVMAASELMDMNWHQINQIKRRAVARGLNQAIDKVRRQEHKVLSSQKDDTLKGSEYLWLTGFENLSEEMRSFQRTTVTGTESGAPTLSRKPSTTSGTTGFPPVRGSSSNSGMGGRAAANSNPLSAWQE
jgi:hypothetical protein